MLKVDAKFSSHIEETKNNKIYSMHILPQLYIDNKLVQ